MRLLEATTQARAATERSRPEGEVHEALTASERAQSDEVHRRLEWLAMLDQAREQPHPVAAYHADARPATMPGPASLKGASRTVVSRARQGPQAPLTGRLPLWCSSYARMLSYPLLHVPCSPSVRVPLCGVHRWVGWLWRFVFRCAITAIEPRRPRPRRAGRRS